ncbi:MAG: Methyltransferase type 11 [uncultured bacterium]|nr:MAG: Methyltransferase type 11 [uncultured bacterium]
MSIFDRYAEYYNLIYNDKNYKAEADYIDRLIKKYAGNSKSILDLGCGTGRHDFLLAESGYDVTGVDFSEKMLEIANRQSETSNSKLRIKYLSGDIRDLRLNLKFDVVAALFHVISYQTSNSDIMSAFKTAFEHVDDEGVFLFDCWYGPAVLNEKPEARVKRMENEKISAVRIAEPELSPNENIVNINYTLIAKNKQNGAVEEIKETHRMRYLFKPEIEFMLGHAGFELIKCEEWLTSKELGLKTWGACFVARK